MDEIKKLAKEANGQTWKDLQKKDLSPDEGVRMLASAYASLHLWERAGGSALNLARGHWLVSRVCCVLSEATLALRHAKLCDRLTNQADDRADFDQAYQTEALARASALSGDLEAARTYKQQARERGDRIQDPEDKKIFLADLESEPWFGL